MINANVYLTKNCLPHPWSQLQFKIYWGFASQDLALGVSVWIFQGKQSLVVGFLQYKVLDFFQNA